MKRVHVVRIAVPRQSPPIRFEFEPGQPADGPIGRMFSGEPFGVKQRQGPGLDRQLEVRAFDAARRLARIDVDAGRRRGDGRGSGDEQARRKYRR
jgi:hypothetical protein